MVRKVPKTEMENTWENNEVNHLKKASLHPVASSCIQLPPRVEVAASTNHI